MPSGNEKSLGGSGAAVLPWAATQETVVGVCGACSGQGVAAGEGKRVEESGCGQCEIVSARE